MGIDFKTLFHRSRTQVRPAQTSEQTVKSERTSMERISDALGPRLRADDTERADLPVGIIHEDILPVSGSVLIASGRIISRSKVDKALDKALKL